MAKKTYKEFKPGQTVMYRKKYAHLEPKETVGVVVRCNVGNGTTTVEWGSGTVATVYTQCLTRAYNAMYALFSQLGNK